MDEIRGQRILWCFACEHGHHTLCIGDCLCGDTHPQLVHAQITRRVA